MSCPTHPPRPLAPVCPMGGTSCLTLSQRLGALRSHAERAASYAQMGPTVRSRSWKCRAGELPGQVLRDAGILHLLEQPGGERSSELARRRCSSRVVSSRTTWSAAARSSPTHGPLLDWLAGHCVETFTKRDTYRALRRLKTAKRAGMALDVLCQYGWIRDRYPEPSARGRGREAYDAHPAIGRAAVDLT